MNHRRPQFRLASWFWLSLVIASFFLGKDVPERLADLAFVGFRLGLVGEEIHCFGPVERSGFQGVFGAFRCRIQNDGMTLVLEPDQDEPMVFHRYSR